MTDQTKPNFKDMIILAQELPPYPEFRTTASDTISWINDWLFHHSRTLDLTKGFQVNRCALYWSGYSYEDGFDGKKFADSCQDSRGNIRQIAQILDTDLQIFELNPASHNQPNDEELALAISYGMMTIEESTQMLCACSFGQGVETAALKAIEALETTENFDAINFMTSNCGLDHAALLGSAIASILKGVPMILEGQSGLFTKLLIEKISGNEYSNLIATASLPRIVSNELPGNEMIAYAILIKTLYAAGIKTDCGKLKDAA